MKVIIASYPKCGTKTLRSALQILGYSVEDYDSHFFRFEAEYREMLTNGSSIEKLREMYKDVEAVSDFPACYFWEEIHKAFPDAKIILSMRRSEDEWLESWDKQMKNLDESMMWTLKRSTTPTGIRFTKFQMFESRVIFESSVQSWFSPWRQPDSELKKNKYKEHVYNVLEKAPKDKLLVFDLSDGWHTLCSFLDKDIPATQFPCENKGGLVVFPLQSEPLFVQIDKEFHIGLILITVISAIMLFAFYAQFA